MTEIYFDNSATTRVSEAAAEAALKAMREEYGNPSSVHGLGAASYRALNEARELFAELLNCGKEDYIFTSCGSESNNTAIYGGAMAAGKGKNKILISSIEHPSVSAPAKFLTGRGFTLIEIPVNQHGTVDLEALRPMLDQQVAVVSTMYVNNETGAIQPLAEIGAMVRELAPDAFFHIDGVQAFARLPVQLKKWQADAFTASGHKIHAPKGVGLLYLNPARHIQPLIRGGGQERGQRSGTENMPGIMAFAAAAKEAYAGMDRFNAQMREVRERLISCLQEQVPDVYVNSPEDGAAHILNLSFLGCRSEVLLHYLEEKGVYVSAGSACNSRSTKGSHVLQAMHLPAERIDSALRFSFSRYNTVEEAEQAATLIGEAVVEVRKIMGYAQKKR